MGHYKVRKLKVQSIKNLINKKGKPKPAKLEAAGKVERQKKGCFSLRSYSTVLYPAGPDSTSSILLDHIRSDDQVKPYCILTERRF